MLFRIVLGLSVMLSAITIGFSGYVAGMCREHNESMVAPILLGAGFLLSGLWQKGGTWGSALIKFLWTSLVAVGSSMLGVQLAECGDMQQMVWFTIVINAVGIALPHAFSEWARMKKDVLPQAAGPGRIEF